MFIVAHVPQSTKRLQSYSFLMRYNPSPAFFLYNLGIINSRSTLLYSSTPYST